MMTLAETIPKFPEILFMPRPKNPDAKGSEAKARYYKNRQPPEGERWTHDQFQQWVEDMGYSRKTIMDSRMWFPFDPKPIARDLGIKTNRVYAYWRGADKGAALTVPPTTTLLCKALLELKRRGRGEK